MLKTEINLLPPLVKQERFNGLVRQRLSRLYWWVVLLVVVVVFLLGGSYAVLYQANRRLQASVTTAVGTLAETESTRQLNQLIRAIQSRVVTNAPWSPLVAAVLELIPPAEVRLTYLEVATGTQLLQIQGAATNRAVVAALEQQLKEVVGIEKVEAPLTNLVLGQGGAFSFMLHRKAVAP